MFLDLCDENINLCVFILFILFIYGFMELELI